FDPTRIHRSTVERWLAVLPTWLTALADSPETVAGTLPLMRDAELDHLLGILSGTMPDWDDGVLAHQLVQAQVARSPDALAVRFEHERLTYAELEAAANRVAHHLRERGVRRDALVCICM